MRNKITISLQALALVIGALSLYKGWGRVSMVMLYTAGGMIISEFFLGNLVFALFKLIRVTVRQEPTPAEPPTALLAFRYASYTLVATSLLLSWTRGL